MDGNEERHRLPLLVHVLVERGGRLLLLRRARTGRADGWWAPPGGHLQRGETPRHAAVRECREEVGLTLEPTELEPLAAMFFVEGNGGLNLLFRASWPPGAPRPVVQLDHGVADAADWFRLDALPDRTIPWLARGLRRVDGGDWYVEPD